MSGETWDLIRIGVVTAVDYARARVQAHFDELELTSDWLPVLQRGAGAACEAYWLPAIGEHVVCAFYSDATEEGVVLGSYYLEDDPPPDSGAGVYYARFPDGSMVKWDNGELSIVAVGGVSVTGDVVVTGGLQISGDLTVGGDAHITGKCYAQQFIQT